MEEKNNYEITPTRTYEQAKFKEEKPGPIESGKSSSRLFNLAPKVEVMAEEIINKYHPHLEEAYIAYIFRTGSWKSKGQVN